MLLLILPWLPGCAVWNFVAGGPDLDDMRVERLEVTDLLDHPEAWYWRNYPPQRSLPSLMVVISTSRELVALTKRYAYTISTEVSYCQLGRFDATRRIASMPGLHDRQGRFGIDAADRPPQQPEPNGRYLSFALIDLSGERSPPTWDAPEGGKLIPFPFDLRWDEHDLCLVVLGGSLSRLTRHRSEAVVIPRALVRAALDRADAPAR